VDAKISLQGVGGVIPPKNSAIDKQRESVKLETDKGELSMRKSRYTESQIIRILKEVEGGRAVKEVCREYGVADATYYNWKSKYGGMEASDIRKLKELDDENRRLKRLYANLSLEHDALKDVIAKKL